MYGSFFLTVAALAAIAGPVSAQTYQRRAVIRGGGNTNQGKCTIEVVVDGAADVEIRGDSATLRNLSGQPAQWRRFECTGPMPANPGDFRFIGIDGRGRQELIRDPGNGGVAVVRIEDPHGGAEGYTFDLTWRGGYPAGPDRDRWDDRGSFATEQATRGCQEAVRQQAAERLRTPNIAFRRTAVDENPGRRDWVIGVFDVRRFGRQETYRFSCSVNLDSGRVRSAQFEPMEGGGYRPGYSDSNASASSQAMESCQRAVEQRLRRDGFGRVDFRSINLDNRPGRNDWIVGTARADGRRGSEAFDFSCAVDLENGAVRSADVRRR